MSDVKTQNYKLLLGDCLERMKEIREGSVDLILADLPYGTTKCKWDVIIPFEPLWEHYWRVIKENGAVVLFAGQPFTTELIRSQIQHFKYQMYWKKERGTGFARSKYQPLRIIEDICVFYKKQPVYNPQMIPLEKPYKHTLPIYKSESDPGAGSGFAEDGTRIVKEYTHKHPTTLLEFPRDNTRKSLHPTRKPVALLEHIIKTYTNEGNIVLDNTMGSGSTGVAAVQTGRRFIGIEKDTNYFNVAVERITKSTVSNGDKNE